MIKAPLPPNEAFRLIDLASYDIIDTAPENDFDEIVELAAQICGTPVSLISLLDENRQWFKSKLGINEKETPRDIAFCAHTILQDGVMEVEDAATDPRFMDNPFVTGETRIRFYAGAPIVSADGHKLGTVCILDHQPKKLSPEQARALTILSNQVSRLLEQRKKNMEWREQANKMMAAKRDVITGMINGQEAEKKIIAESVHEDLAQRVASSIIYIQLAQQDKEKQDAFLDTAKQQLQDILSGMQELSYSITPGSLDLLPAKELVADYARKIASSFPFSVAVNEGSEASNGNAGHAIVVVRILEQWLKNLAANNNVSAVRISVQPNDQFEVLIEDNAPERNGPIVEQEIIASLVYDRARALGGTVEWFGSTGRNVLKVRLPV